MRLLLGPELIWLLLYGAAILVAKANVSPAYSLNSFIENCWFWIPVMAGLTFALWWIPGVEKNWLMLRVWVAGLAGGLLALEKVMKGYSEQGPGIGTAYIMGMIFLFIVLAAGSIFVKIKF